MAETKERSGIFKFFYIILTIITFPIFMLLFILRHPFWVLFLLCAVAGGAAYYPISQGVKPEDILTWYEAKYKAAKFEFVTKAVESGKTDYIPQAVIDEITAAKKKMEEEKAEAARPKSENYNEKIDRDVKIEQAKEDLKKRKKGFKRKGASADKTVGTAAEPGKVTLEATENESRVGAKNVPVQEPSEAEQRSGGTALQNQTEMLEKSGASAGGLASFLNQQQENNADGPADEVLSSGSDVVENSAVNNGVAGNDAAGNRAEKNGTEKSDAAENGAAGNDATGNGAEERKLSIEIGHGHNGKLVGFPLHLHEGSIGEVPALQQTVVVGSKQGVIIAGEQNGVDHSILSLRSTTRGMPTRICTDWLVATSTAVITQGSKSCTPR